MEMDMGEKYIWSRKENSSSYSSMKKRGKEKLNVWNKKNNIYEDQ